MPAQHRMEDLVKEAHLESGEGFSTVWGKIFGNWITDEIIDQEIYRNIGLALLGVMGCTMLVIVNVQVCFWIFVTVLLTLINVGGCMQRVGQTLDIVSCIALQLSVGLCVDYAGTFLSCFKYPNLKHLSFQHTLVTHSSLSMRATEQNVH